ncbi:MAG: thioesterase family protein [Bryobacteraceae bacterium]|nr:thioesterase family protein [Bryobacterales bacterium]MEB2362835.1 thioesterase family protein [Bryobacterales bacterium]NUN01309.1 thioesterase family protein [Bryobacteraceae bacterium]
MTNHLVGTKGETQMLVTSEVAIDFLGGEDARVFGTPYLIGHLEMTARNSVKPLLGEGQDTVGTHVDVRHLAATPMGMSVTLRSEVVRVEDRRITFRVEAYDEKEQIAEGTHDRFIIDIARFTARVRAKLLN